MNVMTPFDPYHKWLGIPADQQPANYYRLLGIEEFEADADVIDTAAEQRTVFLRTFHTGPNSELAARLLNEVSAARVCLLDHKSKALYDTQLKASQQAAQPVAEETVPEEVPVPSVTPQLNVVSKRRVTRTQLRRRPVVKPLWQQPWVMATAGAVGLLLIVFNLGGDDQKPAGSSRGTIAAKVDSKLIAQVPNKTSEEEQQAEANHLIDEGNEKEKLPKLFLKWKREDEWMPGGEIANYAWLLGNERMATSPPRSRLVVQAKQAGQTLFLKGIEIYELFSDREVFTRDNKALNLEEVSIATGSGGTVSLDSGRAFVLKANGGWANLTLKHDLPEFFKIHLTLNHPSRTGWEIIYLYDQTRESQVEIFRTESDRSHNGDFRLTVIRDPIETYAIRAGTRAYSRPTAMANAVPVRLLEPSVDIFEIDGHSIRLKKSQTIDKALSAFPLSLSAATDSQKISFRINKGQSLCRAILDSANKTLPPQKTK